MGVDIFTGNNLSRNISPMYAPLAGCVLSEAKLADATAWPAIPPPDNRINRASWALNGTSLVRHGFDFSSQPTLASFNTPPWQYTLYEHIVNRDTGAQISVGTSTVTPAEDANGNQGKPIQNSYTYHGCRLSNGYFNNLTSNPGGALTNADSGSSYYAIGYTQFCFDTLEAHGYIYVINGNHIGTGGLWLSAYNPGTGALVNSVKIKDNVALGGVLAEVVGFSSNFVWVRYQGSFDHTNTTQCTLAKVAKGASSVIGTSVMPKVYTSYPQGGVKVYCDRFCLAHEVGVNVPVLDIDDSFNSLTTIVLASGSGLYAQVIGQHHCIFPSAGSGDGEIWRIAA